MPEIMNVTNPVPGYQNAAGTRAIPGLANDPNIQNIPVPSRVTRPDANTGEQQSASEQNPASTSRSVHYDSNFYTFFQRLSEANITSADMTQLLSEVLRTVVSSGLRAGTAEDLSAVMQMLQMSEQDFSAFLANQITAGSRFNGPLFSLLRGAYQQADSQGVQGDILQFVKLYSDWSSTAHIQRGILSQLDQIASAMPKSWAGRVTDMTSVLQNLFAAGDRAGGLALLRGKLLPYLSNYVSASHDMGLMRKTLSQLTLFIARYEGASQENLLQAFHRLQNTPSLRSSFADMDDAALLKMLKETPFQHAARSDWFADGLADAAGKALHGRLGTEAQEAFSQLVSSLLVNNSVYMPLNHYILPLEWNGRMMFSELWVDPNAKGQSGSGEEEDGAARLLLKMDVQSLGMLDVVLSCREKAVSVQVFCPTAVAPYTQAIQGALTGILQDNGLQAVSVAVAPRQRPLAISDVFPQIFERMDSVNVTV